MSVKICRQRTARRAWIPFLSFALLAPAAGADEVTGPIGTAAAGTPGTAVASDGTVWQEMMNWMLRRLLEGMHCDTNLPADIPLAMAQVSACYLVSGLAPMSPDEKQAFMATIDETLAAMEAAPSSVPLTTKLSFTTTLKAMKLEASFQ